MKRIFQVFTTLFVVLIMIGNTYDNKDGSDYTFPDSINIHEAAKNGSLEQVQAFLKSGENVDVKDKHGMTPLYYAAVNGHKNVCICTRHLVIQLYHYSSTYSSSPDTHCPSLGKIVLFSNCI